jgi:tight adherence protein B
MSFVLLSFLLVFALVMACVVFIFLYGKRRQKENVKEMLRVAAGEQAAPVAKILKDAVMPEVTRLYDRLGTVNLAKNTEDLLRTAGLNWSPLLLLGASALAAVPGFVLGLKFPYVVDAFITCLILGGASATLPYLYVRHCRAKRLSDLEEQFPEALDFLARSVRAGHSFSISLSMVSDNVPQPLALELQTLFNEINLGAPLTTAFQNFTTRVPLLDFRFFTSAVLLQRQTGGNISEILGRLAHVIRERFRLKGEVKAASAHGKMTAGILTILPLLTALALMAVAPGYLQGMMNDPDGKYMLMGAGGSVLLGNYFIKRIVKIKV